MLMSRISPVVFLGAAVSQFKQGEDGWGTFLVCLSAFLTIVLAIMDDYDNEKRKRNERR